MFVNKFFNRFVLKITSTVKEINKANIQVIFRMIKKEAMLNISMMRINGILFG